MQKDKLIIEPQPVVDQGEWLETSSGITYVVDDQVQFEDDYSHWKNGLCRLLEISEAQARSLIALAVSEGQAIHQKLFHQLSDDQKVQALKQAIQKFFAQSIASNQSAEPKPQWGRSFDGALPDRVFAASISGNRQRMIVGSSKLPHAWQIDSATQKKVGADSVTYDSDYYQSPKQAHCGMRHYVDHSDWRMEKARRLLRNVLKVSGLQSSAEAGTSEGAPELTLLDVGSAVGYFRQAAQELEITHYGLDLSADAIALCKQTFGFDTIAGDIANLPVLAPELLGKCDIITLWDTIEHIDDPLEAMKTLKGFLSERGVIVIRTPNLNALEADLLQDMYYSYKLDHIHYFSPMSLNKLFAMATMRLVNVETSSHIFKGLLGANYLYQAGKELRGADILAVFSA